MDAALGGGPEKGVDRVAHLGDIALAEDGVEGADETARLVAALLGHQVEHLVAQGHVHDVLGGLELDPALDLGLGAAQVVRGEHHGAITGAHRVPAAVVRGGLAGGGKVDRAEVAHGVLIGRAVRTQGGPGAQLVRVAVGAEGLAVQTLHRQQTQAEFGGVLLATVIPLPLGVLGVVDDPGEPGPGPGVSFGLAEFVPGDIVEDAQEGRSLLHGRAFVHDFLEGAAQRVERSGVRPFGELLGFERQAAANGFDGFHLSILPC